MTSKRVLIFLSILTSAASLAFWWIIESTLTESKLVAGSYALIMMIGPPLFLAFFVPDTAIGMAIKRSKQKTIGQVVAGLSLFVMLGHTIWMMQAWWLAQPATEQSGLATLQVGVGIVAIFIQALVIQPAMTVNASEQLKQAHLVKRYELQAQADIAIIRATLNRALELNNKRTPSQAERQELTDIMYGLTSSIDKSIREAVQSVEAVTGITLDVQSLLDNPDVSGVMEYIGDEIEQVKREEIVRFRVPGKTAIYTLPVIRWEPFGVIVKNNSNKEVKISKDWIIH